MLAVRMQDTCFIMVDLLLEYIFKNCITFIRFFIFVSFVYTRVLAVIF